MKKNIIYVDFIFTRKRINYINYYFLIAFSFLNKYIKLIFTSKNTFDSLDTQIKKVQ